ncbi:MAG TPA: arabinose transporter [Stellaceae bacterium]|nr:arabinose transporter [Stellaceae bacterium]
MTTTTAAATIKTAHFLPYTTIAFLGFLSVGIPLPVLPIEIHAKLGYGAAAIGVAIGAQSLATVFTRQLAGHLSDTIGAKKVSMLGLVVAALVGVVYALSMRLPLPAPAAFALMLAARLLLGLAESFYITGCLAWSISMVGVAHSGRAMAWNGMAMYAAIAFGAPLGTFLYAGWGFLAVAGVTVVLPLMALPMAMAMVPAPISARRGSRSVLGGFIAIWIPGLGMALASSGFGTIAAFLALRYAESHWAHAGWALTGFGVAYLAMRLFFAGLPDKLGGKRVVIPCLIVEAAGLVLIWQSVHPLMALGGAMLTGLGYSLVFPSLGVEAVRHLAPDNRAMALGAYLACFDIGLAAAGPIMGTVAGSYGLPSAFLAAACAALLSLAVVVTLLGKNRAV